MSNSASPLCQQAVIYFAGGCFWGMEALMRKMPGVIHTETGYANGSTLSPTYAEVKTGATGHRETCRVVYDPMKTSLEKLLFAYFAAIDPTLRNRQGHDIGSQYQAGVYYTEKQSEKIVRRVAEIERHRAQPFCVEILPLLSFWPAEEYHQMYLEKNPGGYCHIEPMLIRRLTSGLIDPGAYEKPAQETLRETLTGEQYAVTQQAATEAPFTSEFWKSREKGIYVDITTGEPLFLSTDKFQSACGWPAFSKPIDPNVLIEREDRSLSRVRTEVRSRAGDAHLGHVFPNDPESPSGTRYCINGASLRFIPAEKMKEEGYGFLLSYIL